jgi:hypothetical protein
MKHLKVVAPGSNPWSCIQENNLAESHNHLQSGQLQIARVRIWEHPITSEVLETNDEIWHINRVKGKAFWLHYKQFEYTLPIGKSKIQR